MNLFCVTLFLAAITPPTFEMGVGGRRRGRESYGQMDAPQFQEELELLSSSFPRNRPTPTCDGQEFGCTGRPSGRYPDPYNCTNFFTCQPEGQYTILTSCDAPKELNWDTLECGLPDESKSCTPCPRPPPPTTPTCSEGEQWDPSTGECQVFSSTTVPPLPEFCYQPFSCVGRPDGNYRDPWNCETFYVCMNGAISKRISDVKGGASCVPKCPNVPRPTTLATTTTPTPWVETCTISCTNKPNGKYPSPVSCEEFYTCGSGIVTGEFTCSGLYFNPTNSYCEGPNPNLVCWGCAEGTTTLTPVTTTTTTSTTPVPPRAPCSTMDSTLPSPWVETCTESCENKPDGKYPSPYNCQDFYSCSAGVLTTYTCIEGSYYNPTNTYCEGLNPCLVCWSCVDGTTTTSPVNPSTVTTTPTPSTWVESCTETCDGKPNGYYPSPVKCDYFYSCNSGAITPFSCSEGKSFNPKTLLCEAPNPDLFCWSCNEGTTTLTPITTPTPTESPTPTTPTNTETPTNTPPPSVVETCTATCENRPHGVYADPSNCQSYYFCTPDGIVLQSCYKMPEWNSELIFNYITLTCEPDSVSICYSCVPGGPITLPTTTIGTTTPSTTTTTAPPPDPSCPPASCAGIVEGLFPSPTSCHDYYICQNTVMYSYSCEHLLYNSVTQTCDPPSDLFMCSNCSNNGIPPPQTTPSPTTTPTATEPSVCSDVQEFSCEGRADAWYEVLWDCHTSYKCEGGALVDGIYNETECTSTCSVPPAIPWTSTTTTTTPTPPIITTTEFVPTGNCAFTCGSSEYNGFTPTPWDCTKFFLCKDGNRDDDRAIYCRLIEDGTWTYNDADSSCTHQYECEPKCIDNKPNPAYTGGTIFEAVSGGRDAGLVNGWLKEF